jgi:predicted AlkP superfamily phosphohydrolase/phosphomutase
VAGCSSTDRSDRKVPEVVILGVDGFDWNIVDPLVEAGRMPVMKRLLDRGTRADLLTLVPLEKSPIIWTTIATGRSPGERGRGFLTPADSTGKQHAYAAWNRRYRAFWNILPTNGVSVSVLGWLETWPAEEVDGTIVTDYVQYYVAGEKRGAGMAHRTFPEGLYDEIESYIVYPEDVSVAALAGLVDRDPSTEALEPFVRSGLDALRWIRAGDESFTALAREFFRNRAEDVMAVYLRGPDAVCHRFWGAREAAARGETTDESSWFGGTVDRYFEATDGFLGEILEEIDLERTTLVLVSDHGFQGSRQALDGSMRAGIWMHRELGTLLIAGPLAAGEGIRVRGARVQDVLPTILHALDVPVGADMDGEVIRELLGPEGGRDRPVRTIPTYETDEPRPPAGAVENPIEEQIRERVTSLGYIE